MATATMPRQEFEIDGGEIVSTEVMPMTALESITRAEVDIQIATAKRFPRSITRAISEAKSIVGLDPDLAAACTYFLPARSKDDPPITGPSVRLAEIMATSWGNIRIVGRITDDDGKFLTAQAVAMDLEKNVGYSVEIRRSVMTKAGRRFGDNMIQTTANAAIALATRNATFKVIPRAFIGLVQEEARKVARGDVKDLPQRRQAAIRWFGSKGVGSPHIFEALGVGGEADITLDHLEALNGMRTALSESRATIEELFPSMVPKPQEKPREAASGSKADRIASKLEPTTERQPGEDG